MQHLLVHLSNAFNKQQLIQQLLTQKATGAFAYYNQYQSKLFSPFIIQQLLEEEQRHDFSGIPETREQTLRSMSSGEQKKLVLHYLLTQEPQVLILDNVFDNLDTASQATLRKELQEVGRHAHLIQLIHRQRDGLSFIHKHIVLADDGTERSAETGQQQTTHLQVALPVPPPPEVYQRVNNELISFRNVSVSYNGRPVLQQINWTIHAGEFWHLKGPNGSGKTTLLTMITGDNVKGYGQELYLFGKKKGSGESVWDIKNKIGYLTPSMTDLFATRHTLEEMILSGCKDSIGLYSLPSDLQQRTASEWLNCLQLQRKAKQPFCSLSPGEQRMALIARAMIKHPPLLILDEPLTGLDDPNADKTRELINRMAAASQSAIIYVSHQTEKGLLPQKVFELIKTPNGSVGRVV